MRGSRIMAQRRDFGKAFKAKVAIEAIKGEKTINERLPLSMKSIPAKYGNGKSRR